MQAVVIEQQIQVVILAVHFKVMLTADEREASTKLEEELTNVSHEPSFEGAFLGLHHSLALAPPEETHEYVAESDVAAWRFAPDKFKALMREHPPLADTVIGILATRLSFMVDAVASASLLGAEARVARCLLKSERDAELKVLWAKSSTSEFNVSQAQLARMLGLSRQSVGTTLREFEQRGLIAMRRQKIELLNSTALREIVSGVATASVK